MPALGASTLCSDLLSTGPFSPTERKLADQSAAIAAGLQKFLHLFCWRAKNISPPPPEPAHQELRVREEKIERGRKETIREKRVEKGTKGLLSNLQKEKGKKKR